MEECVVFSQPNLVQSLNPGRRAVNLIASNTNEMWVPRLLLQKVALDAPAKRSDIAWHDPKFSARMASRHVCETPATTRASNSSYILNTKKRKVRRSGVVLDQQQVIRLKSSLRGVPCSGSVRRGINQTTQRGRCRPSGREVSEKLMESLDE